MTIEIGADFGHGVNTLPETGSKGLVINGVYYAEHTFNSEVGKRMIAILQRHGIVVHMAQKPYERDVPLSTRTAFYNSKPNIKLIVSIHANATKDTSVRGLCAFYWSTSANSKRAADIYKKYCEAYGQILYSGGTEPSVEGTWSEFAMCRDTNAPTILTENGFMTNAQDFELIFKNQNYLQVVAEINARTILEYVGVAYVEETQPSVQILTGGLVSANAKLFIDYMMEQGWWAEVRVRAGVNPRGLTGGLDPEMRAKCEAWLKDKGWGYAVYESGKVPN